MSKTLTILLSILVSVVYAQDIKTYTGIYEGGNASYQYYENENYERIFHGRFNYNYGNGDFFVSGQFAHNLRNGSWKVSKVIRLSFDRKKKVVATVTANYTNGKLNGYCSYEEKDIQKNLTLSKTSAYFKNNVMIGKMNFSFIGEKYFTLLGCLHLNREGYADSTLRINYTKYGVNHEQIMQFREGFLVSNLNRNLSTGEILNKSNRRKFVDDFFKYYNEEKKYALIPIVEVVDDVDSPFFMRNENDGNGNNFSQLKNDTLRNAPISYESCSFVGGHNSFRPIYDALNFWSDISNNPLYFIKKGVIIPSLNPIKTPVLEKEIYNKICDEDLAEELEQSRKKCAVELEQTRRQERMVLLDSLKNVVLKRILFTSAIVDTANKSVSAMISKLPVSMFIHQFYTIYTDYSINNKDYFNNEYKVEKDNRIITDFISEIKKGGGAQNHYISRIADYRINLENTAKWFGCRIASNEEVKIALDKKEITLPQGIYNSDLCYWFIKLQ